MVISLNVNSRIVSISDNKFADIENLTMAQMKHLMVSCNSVYNQNRLDEFNIYFSGFIITIKVRKKSIASIQFDIENISYLSKIQNIK